MEVSVDPRRADDKDFLVQTVVDHRQALRSAKAFSKKMKKELAERMDKDRQKLMLRSVDELKALLVYLEAEFDESIDDKEKLVRLVVNQKNAVGMAKRHSPQHALLAGLPFKGCVTSNFDELFELAVRGAGVDTAGGWAARSSNRR